MRRKFLESKNSFRVRKLERRVGGLEGLVAAVTTVAVAQTALLVTGVVIAMRDAAKAGAADVEALAAAAIEGADKGIEAAAADLKQ